MQLFINQPLFTIHGTPISIGAILVAILFLCMSLVIAQWVRRVITRASSLHKYVSSASLYTTGRFSYYSILVIGIYGALLILGIDLSSLAMIVGALSVGIGFGLQAFVNNFVAGVVILIEKKVRVGARLQLESGELGVVKEVNMRSTLLQTLDHRRIAVPNTEMIAKKVVHWTWEEDNLYRLRIPVVLQRGIDKELIKRSALRAVEHLPHTVMTPPPHVWLTQLDATSQTFEVVVWVNDDTHDVTSQSISAAYLWALEDAFTQDEIPLIAASRCVEKASPLQEL